MAPVVLHCGCGLDDDDEAAVLASDGSTPKQLSVSSASSEHGSMLMIDCLGAEKDGLGAKRRVHW